MQRYTVALLAGLGVAACASVPQAAISPAPTCSTDSDCTAKWAVARTFVIAHAGYKIQTYFPDLIQTSNPSNDDSKLAAQVNKNPSPWGGYRIEAQFYCANTFGCSQSARDTLDQFNREVSAAGTSSVIWNPAQSAVTAAK
jgi:hypothetical protein